MTNISEKRYFCVKINEKIHFYSLIHIFFNIKNYDTYSLFRARKIYFSMSFV